MKLFDALVEKVMHEQIVCEKKGWAKKASKSAKKGKMHELLGVKDGETIQSKYDSGESLGRALSRKVGKNKAIKMLNFASNVGGGNKLFKAAVNFLKESIDMGSGGSSMAEWEFTLNKSESNTSEVVKKIRAIAAALRKKAADEFKTAEAKYDKMDYKTETEFLRGGGRAPMESFVEIEIENDVDTTSIILRAEDAAAANEMVKGIYDDAAACGLVTYYGDDKPEWLLEKEGISTDGEEAEQIA